MPQLWLPIQEATTGRRMLVYIPGAASMDIGQLKAIIEAEREITLEQLKERGPKPIARMSKEDIRGALREFIQWKNNHR